MPLLVQPTLQAIEQEEVDPWEIAPAADARALRHQADFGQVDIVSLPVGAVGAAEPAHEEQEEQEQGNPQEESGEHNHVLSVECGPSCPAIIGEVGVVQQQDDEQEVQPGTSASTAAAAAAGGSA